MSPTSDSSTASLGAARDTVERGGDVGRDVVRLGFLDQAASASLVAVARRQDALNRSAWQSLAEAGHVIAEVRRRGVSGLAATVHTYVDGGTMRTSTDDLVIALVRSHVEPGPDRASTTAVAQSLVARIEAITRDCTDVLPAIRLGAGRAPLLPTVSDLRAARDAEIRAAFDAAVKDGARSTARSATDRLRQHTGPLDRTHVVPGRAQPWEPSPADAETRLRDAPLTGSAQKADPWHRAGSWVIDDIGERASVFPLLGGDGRRRTLIQMPGSVNGVPGRFEWILDGDHLTHRLFVRDGKINGVPIKP